MIDEKKLIYDIYSHDIDIPDSITESNTTDLDAFLLGVNAKQIAVMKDIRNQPKVGEWIPVSEGLPEPYETVLVTAKMQNDVHTLVYMGSFNGEGQLALCGVSNPEDYKGFAWMPLPEPWKGE